MNDPRDPQDVPQGLLREVLEALSEGLAIFDADRRLVLCNRAYRDIYRPAGQHWERGVALEQMARDVAMHCVGIDEDEVVDAWVDVRMRVDGAQARGTEQRMRGDAIRGLTPADVLGESAATIERRERHDRTVIETGKPLVRDGERADATGRRRHLLIEKRPFSDSAGEVVGVCSAITDITRLKDIEDELLAHRNRLEELVEERTAELRRANEELVRSERLSAIGQLTATVAHELRHPLGTIDQSVKAITRLAADGGPIPAVLLERVERNVRRADQTIGELLAYTQVAVVDLQDVALDGLVAAVLEDQLIPAHVEVVLELDAVRAMADESRFSRALANVVSNALQAIGPATSGSDQARLHIACGALDGCAFVSVTDSGPGIPAGLRERVFDPLFSTKSFGTGLGLPLVQRVMEQHGGGVELDDAAGGGAVVTLRFPPAEASAT